MAKQLTPFEVEHARAKFAAQKNFKQLAQTYTKKLPEISDHNTPNMWDGINLLYKTNGQHPMEDERISIVANFIQGENSSIFNIGFGSGNLEKEYFKKNKSQNNSWQGIDISPKSVKKATKEYPFAKFSLGSIEKLPMKNNSCDYVIALEVLEHIPPHTIMKALSEISRVTKTGKYFIVSVPLNEGLEAMVSRGENPNAHVRVYTPELIKAELEMNGFSTKHEKFFFAFHKNYVIKSLIAKYFQKKFKPNNILIIAQKSFT